MKTNKNHILRSWLLLLFFAAGQFVVWSHQHSFQEVSATYHQQKQHSRPVLTDNCKLCDAMHHTYVGMSSPVYFAPLAVAKYAYYQVTDTFTSISPVQSIGRAPPVA